MSIEAIPGQPLTIQQLNYILNGACIMGSGGGGPYPVGQQVLKYIGTRTVYLLPAVNVPDNLFTPVSAFFGPPHAAANHALHFNAATTPLNPPPAALCTALPSTLPP